MFIENIADYLQKLKKRDIKPEIFTVFEFPDDLTILEILNSIGYRLANLFGFVKINTTTKTIDTGEASVNVTGDVDNLNFDFKIPRGKTGPQGPAGPGVAAGGTTGQVLAKKSDANYDTEWIDIAGGSGLTKTILWTNSNPSAEMGRRTITIPEDTANFKMVEINFLISTTVNTVVSTLCYTDETYKELLLNYYGGYRALTFSGRFIFLNYAFKATTNEQDNTLVIPLNFIGYN